MQKPLALTIAVCLGFAGCQVFEKSETWDQAMKVRPGETTRDPDPSNAYASKLHAAFAERGVEHKVVVYQYRYTTRLREEAVGTRTAVIYRDDSNPRYPWWLKDDRSMRPVWLPNGELDKQISFYIRRKAEVIEQKPYPAQSGSGKTSIAFARPAPVLRIAAQPQPAAPVAKTAPAKKAPAPVVVRKPAPVPQVAKAPEVRKPVPTVVAAKPPTIKKTAPQTVIPKIKPVKHTASAAPFFAPQPAPKAEAAPLEPIASRSSAPWSPPAILDTKEQSDLTAPRDIHLEKLFRAKHGTDYNRFSPTDRRKMQQLQNAVAGAE